MSRELLDRLECKIDAAIETIELLRLQIEECEERNTVLHTENSTLKNKHVNWENNLNQMIEKLDLVEPKKNVFVEESKEEEVLLSF